MRPVSYEINFDAPKMKDKEKKLWTFCGNAIESIKPCPENTAGGQRLYKVDFDHEKVKSGNFLLEEIEIMLGKQIRTLVKILTSARSTLTNKAAVRIGLTSRKAC